MTSNGPDAGSVTVRHVLVPLDGSDLALRAMPTAQVLAARFAAEVNTVSVGRDEADAERLRVMAASALGVDPADARVHVISDTNPASAITARAHELDACLVCMASHGRGRLRGALVGSVARSVLQAWRDPMLVLGPSADNPGWSPRPRNWPEPLSTPRLVACVDGSATSEQVLPVAASWAAALEMSLTILTVVGDESPPFRGDTKSSHYSPHADAASYVEALAEQWNHDGGVAVEGDVSRDPIGPASGVRAYLAERPAGLLAVTTHARSGMQRALLGAQAANIVNASVVPCLVAPVNQPRTNDAEDEAS